MRTARKLYKEMEKEEEKELKKIKSEKEELQVLRLEMVGLVVGKNEPIEKIESRIEILKKKKDIALTGLNKLDLAHTKGLEIIKLEREEQEAHELAQEKGEYYKLSKEKEEECKKKFKELNELYEEACQRLEEIDKLKN